MAQTNTLRRSMLAIPANSQQLVAKAANSDADEVFFDLEDSLAPSEKPDARETIIEAVEQHDWGETLLSYRLNGTDTRWWYDDIIEPVTEIGSEVDTLIVPKVSCPGDLQTVETLVEGVEKNVGLLPGEIGLSAQIETATGINAAVDIAQASDRLTGIIFGPADYAASIGATGGVGDYPGHYWHYPLSRVAHAAASANLQRIGGPYPTEDLSEFREACTTERALGYDGKVVIHPDQVAVANDVFAPDPAEAQRARRVVDRYQEADPTDVIAIDGKVIDKEMYRMAKRILSKAKKADII